MLKVFHAYDDALRSGDISAVRALLSPDIVWHQPGSSDVSGDVSGPNAVIDLLSSLMVKSGGTLTVATETVMVNGPMVAVNVRFDASRADGWRLEMGRVDVFRIDGPQGLIDEVWLFSADQEAEDLFWTT